VCTQINKEEVETWRIWNKRKSRVEACTQIKEEEMKREDGTEGRVGKKRVHTLKM
jgi:hypothetical protein